MNKLFFFVLLLILLITSNLVFAEDLNYIDTNFTTSSDFNAIYIIHSLKVTSFSVPEKPLLNHDFVFQLSLSNDENTIREAVIYCSLEQEEKTVKTCNSKTLSFQPFEEKAVEFKFKLDNIQAVHSLLTVTVNYDLNKKNVLMKGVEVQNPSLIDSLINFFQELAEGKFEFEGKEIPFALIIIVGVIVFLVFRD